jgi:hypothetical protein
MSIEKEGESPMIAFAQQIEKEGVTMNLPEHKPIYTEGGGEPTYLDIQAEAGISKHMGGYAATDALHRLCHLEEAQEVLEVGCGIGVGPAYIAKRLVAR